MGNATDGAVIFVKLRQMRASETALVRIDTNDPLLWSSRDGCEICPLYSDGFEQVAMQRMAAPQRHSFARVKAAFRDAPLKNPDGSTGISFHYVIDDEIDTEDAVEVLGKPNAPSEFPCPEEAGCNPQEDSLTGLSIYEMFDPIKAEYSSRLRHGAYHYALYAAQMTRFAKGFSFHINGHDFAIALDHPTVEHEAGVFMHELGHNLGLKHGGNDHFNYKLNYLSGMNYTYVDGVVRDGVRVLDDSRHPVAAIPEASIDERLGFAPGPGTTEKDLERYTLLENDDLPILGNASFDLDINRNGVIDPAPYDWDYNGDGDLEDEVEPASQNDWEALRYDARGSIGVARTWLLQEGQPLDELVSNGPLHLQKAAVTADRGPCAKHSLLSACSASVHAASVADARP